MLSNACTQVLTYGRDGNHVTPGGDGTPVNVMHHGGTSWARLQIGDKNKCLSSQWGGSYNHAGVMYHCAVDVGGEVTRLENTLEPTKQWWLIVPVGNHDDAGTHDNAALVAAQQLSVKTREKAMGISKRAQGFGLSGSMISRRYADAELAQDDLSKRAAAPGWRERILAARRKHVAGREAARDASTSKPAATKAKPAVKIALKEAPKGVDKGVSLNVKPQNKPVVEVEEEVSPPVPTGDRYFIIPTDHLWVDGELCLHLPKFGSSDTELLIGQVGHAHPGLDRTPD